MTYLYFNIDKPYFEQMVGQIYPTELQLNKANSSDIEAPFLDLNLSITNGIVSSKIYDKRGDFNFNASVRLHQPNLKKTRCARAR